MTKSHLDNHVDVSRHVAETASRLNERLGAVSADIRHSLEEDIPELRGDAGVVELLGASVEGNVDTILRALRDDIAVQQVEAPAAALEYARRLAQYGVPVNALVRAYRLGQRRVTELVTDEVRALDIDPSTRFAVMDAIGATLFEYIDWISQQVVVVYEDERERWLENQNNVRALRVREVLAGEKAIDIDAATTSIGYPLRWHHLALVMWYPDLGAEAGELVRLQRFLRELAQAAQAAASPLFVAADRVTGWAWLSYRAAAPDAVSTVRQFALARPDSPSVTIGTMAPGLEGFRISHREAEGARRVAIAGGARVPAVVAAADAGLSLAALLAGNIVDACEWVSKVLGDLAVDSENDARLRETLHIYLRGGCSYTGAADELGMHFNSVKYRVGRAVARRGRPIDADRLDVEVALVLCKWYGTAVLRPSPA
ncbi:MULTISPECIES: helix-turn-helix domain-containing protein [unclassified Mycolicibacterium]|uniref:helix-turn-helix domain-containing protein n=1 Tax=unclassified Mycolicibacterium TaxID=2636767 RepID=UPI002ED8BB28